MDLEVLLQKLLKAGRNQPAQDRVPYAFEKRIMAQLTRVKPFDAWSVWAQGLWRAVLPCLAVMVACGLLTQVFLAPSYPGDLSRDLEATVMTSLDLELEDLW